MSTRKLKIGLLGCGTVGGGLLELVAKNSSLIRQRAGVELSVTKILVRDSVKARPGVDHALLTTDPGKVLNNGCDLVVELVGGIEPARNFIHRSLTAGKHVVTANKALLALDGFSLLHAAELQRVRLGFEASVCGGIPIIRSLRNGLVGNRIQSITGILNGTCNYILTRMTEDGTDFDAALADAQARGFAEADPSLDIDGHDAAQKLKILAELAFNARLSASDLSAEGIRGISADDIRSAKQLGFVIKHLAAAELKDNTVALQVRPMLLPHDHQLAAVRDENNAVLVRGDAVGEMLFCGKGAGSLPSASAVLSDIVDIACHRGGFSAAPRQSLPVSVSGQHRNHYLRVPVADPSAIGVITSVLERNGIGVTRASAQWAKQPGGVHQVQVFTSTASSQNVRRCMQDCAGISAGQPVILPAA